LFEASRDVVREIAETEEYQQSRKGRKKVEVLFSQTKLIMNFDRLRLLGISGAGDEFVLSATIQNLKKLVKQRYKSPKLGINPSNLCRS